MTWKVRPEGSPQVREGLTTEQVLTGLEEGEWSPTDEVRGPDDRDWVQFENHPVFAEAVAMEPLPSHDDDETHVDMTPLIDVAMVLLVFFILIFTYSVLEKRLDAPNASAAHAGPAIITKEEVKQQMIQVTVRRQEGRSVFQVEDKVVPKELLLAEMRGYVRKDNRTTLLLDADPDVPHGDTVYVEDMARGAGMERVLLLAPPEKK
jgi:biopolymer transport protein ExbD